MLFQQLLQMMFIVQEAKKEQSLGAVMGEIDCSVEIFFILKELGL